MGVHLAQREVPKDKTQLLAEVRQHDFQGAVGLEAGGALEVAVLDDCDRGGRAAAYVVYGLVGFKQRVRRVQGGHGVHLSSTVPGVWDSIALGCGAIKARAAQRRRCSETVCVISPGWPRSRGLRRAPCTRASTRPGICPGPCACP